MIVGSIDKMNEVTDTIAVVKPTKEGKFVYNFIVKGTGKKSLPLKFVHEAEDGDTVSVNGMSVKHTYYVVPTH